MTGREMLHLLSTNKNIRSMWNPVYVIVIERLAEAAPTKDQYNA